MVKFIFLGYIDHLSGSLRSESYNYSFYRVIGGGLVDLFLNLKGEGGSAIEVLLIRKAEAKFAKVAFLGDPE